MEVVDRHPDFKRYELRDEPALQLPGLEIYPDQRKIYRDRREIHMTAKENVTAEDFMLFTIRYIGMMYLLRNGDR